jgi:hypothetical protein
MSKRQTRTEGISDNLCISKFNEKVVNAPALMQLDAVETVQIALE